MIYLADSREAVSLLLRMHVLPHVRGDPPPRSLSELRGELVTRPRRPAEKLVTSPASTKRIYKPDGCEADRVASLLRRR